MIDHDIYLLPVYKFSELTTEGDSVKTEKKFPVPADDLPFNENSLFLIRQDIPFKMISCGPIPAKYSVLANKDFEFKRAFKFNYGQLVPKNEIGDSEEYREVYVKYSKIKTGDILINGLNLNYDFITQRVACAPSDGIITSAYVVCRPRDGVNYRYFTYLFKGMDSMKLFHGMGSGIRLTLSFKEMKKQIIPLPPLTEQRAIVSYLDDKTSKIDTLVAKLQQEIEAIKEYKQRLISDVVTGQIKVC